jgi:hypothetical protein
MLLFVKFSEHEIEDSQRRHVFNFSLGSSI